MQAQAVDAKFDQELETLRFSIKDRSQKMVLASTDETQRARNEFIQEMILLLDGIPR